MILSYVSNKGMKGKVAGGSGRGTGKPDRNISIAFSVHHPGPGESAEF